MEFFGSLMEANLVHQQNVIAPIHLLCCFETHWARNAEVLTHYLVWAQVPLMLSRIEALLLVSCELNLPLKYAVALWSDQSAIRMSLQFPGHA